MYDKRGRSHKKNSEKNYKKNRKAYIIDNVDFLNKFHWTVPIIFIQLESAYTLKSFFNWLTGCSNNLSKFARNATRSLGIIWLTPYL